MSSNLQQGMLILNTLIVMLNAQKKNHTGILHRPELSLKGQFGCNPPTDWNLLMFENEFIKNVCIVKGYQANEPPTIDPLTDVFFSFYRADVLGIDEVRRTLTIDLRMKATWEDPRIKANLAEKDSENIIMPAITIDKDPLIWTPFQTMRIFGLKDKKYLHHPVTIGNIKLNSSTSVTFSRFSENRTLISACIEWQITQSCKYKFSIFPLDRHICKVSTISDYINAKVYHLRQKTRRRILTPYETNGFNISNLIIANRVKRSRAYGFGYSRFGIQITLRRQIEPYIYQYYLPCILIVLASSLSFIVPVSMMPGRIALLGTLFLTLINIFTHQKVCISDNYLDYLTEFKLSS